MCFSLRCLVAAVLVLICASLEVAAYQIAPNPNYGTIRIESGAAAYNNEDFYNFNYVLDLGQLTNNFQLTNNYRVYIAASANLQNYGTYTNNSTGSTYNYGELINQAGGTFTNYHRLINHYLGKLTNQGVLTNRGKLANKGELTIQAGAYLENFKSLVVASEGTLTNYGVLDNKGFLYNYGVLINQYDSVATNAGTFVSFSKNLFNYGTMNNNGPFRLYGTLTNSGEITNYSGFYSYYNYASRLGSELVNQAGGLFTNQGGFRNRGKFTLTNNPGGVIDNRGTMKLESGNLVNNFGIFDNHGKIRNRGGGLTNQAGAVLHNYHIYAMGLLTNYGALINDGRIYRATLTNSGVVTNQTNGRINSSFINTSEGLVDNYGYIINYGTLTNYGALINHPGSSLENYGTLTSYADAMLTNDGLLINTGKIIGSGAYTQTTGHTTNQGTLEAAAIAILGGSLSGAGIMNGPVEIGAEATVHPGNKYGQGPLTINGALASSGTFTIDIYGRTTGQYGLLDINGEALFDGGAIGLNFRRFRPAAGDFWDFFFADTFTGWETLECTVNLSQRYEWEIASFADRKRLEITTVYTPLPPSFHLLWPGIAALLLGRAWSRRQRKV